MSRQLINRSPDLKKLEDDGYELEIRAGHLVVHNVPYVNANKKVKHGRLVCALDLAGDTTDKPNSHVAMFSGEYPCDKDGRALEKIRNSSNRKELGDGLTIDHTFSSKPLPSKKYDDYHQKVETYVNMITRHVQEIDSEQTAKTFRVIETDDPDSVFNYIDSASSRAEITAVSEKLKIQKIAIVGLGGTGSYVLDFLAKTPVEQIHLYDKDPFLQHNAFRTPGAASIKDLKTRPKKVDYFEGRYAPLRKNIFPHNYNIDESNIEELGDMDFVFLCMDANPIKKLIVDKLEEFGVPFIDVGMGLELVDDRLHGVLRVTTSTKEMRDHVRNKQRIPFPPEDYDDDYATNIQVADLNALNAVLAVIKWKKIYGFYADLENEHYSTYTIDGNVIVNEDKEK